MVGKGGGNRWRSLPPHIAQDNTHPRANFEAALLDGGKGVLNTPSDVSLGYISKRSFQTYRTKYRCVCDPLGLETMAVAVGKAYQVCVLSYVVLLH